MDLRHGRRLILHWELGSLGTEFISTSHFDGRLRRTSKTPKVVPLNTAQILEEEVIQNVDLDAGEEFDPLFYQKQGQDSAPAVLGLSTGDPLGDSGTAFHIVGEDTIESKRIKDLEFKTLDEPINIVTANGKTPVYKTTEIWIDQLQLFLEFLVVPKCPLAIGL